MTRKIWWIVQQNLLSVQIKFEFTKGFKRKYTAKFYIRDNSHHIITFQLNLMICSLANKNSTILACMCRNANSVLLWKTRMANVWSFFLCVITEFKFFIHVGINHNYRPQWSWGKVIFPVVCVSRILSTGGSTWAGTPPPGGYIPLGIYTPLGRYTPRQVHPPMVNGRAVRILLECIIFLVDYSYVQHQCIFL